MKTKVLVSAVMLVVLALLVACDKRESPLVVVAHPWIGYEPMFMAYREGWINSAQVTLLEKKNASESIDALKKGEAQAAALTLDEALSLRQSGEDVQVVMIFDKSTGADMVIAKNGFTSTETLRSAKIGVEKSTVGAVMLRKVLSKYQLSEADVAVIDIDANKHESAWISGQVDVLVSYEPVVSRLMEKGGINLFDSSEIPDLIFDVLVVRREQAERFSEEIKNLVGGNLQAVKHYKKHRKDMAYRMANHLGLSPDDVLLSLRGIEMIGVDRNKKYLQEGGGLSRAANEILNDHLSLGEKDRERLMEDFVSNRYLP